MTPIEAARIAVIEAMPGDTDWLSDDESECIARAAVTAFLVAVDEARKNNRSVMCGATITALKELAK